MEVETLENSQDFRISRVFLGNAARAMRSAVLFSVPSVGRKTRHRISAGLSELRILWRRRLKELAKGGWEPLATGRMRYLAGECPPFGVETNKQSWCCFLRQICPFCHARRVQDSYYRVIRAIYGNLQTRNEFDELIEADPSLDLWTIDKTVVVSQQESSLKALGELREELKYYRDLVDWPVGVLTVCSVAPDSANLTWVARGALLFVISNEKTPSGPLTPEFKTREVTRGAVARALGFVCRYPPGLLLGDPDQTVRLLDTLKGQRLWSHAGALRQKSSE